MKSSKYDYNRYVLPIDDTLYPHVNLHDISYDGYRSAIRILVVKRLGMHIEQDNR